MIFTGNPITYDKYMRFENIEVVDFNNNPFNIFYNINLDNIKELLDNNPNYSSRVIINDKNIFQLEDNFIINEMYLKGTKILADINFMNKRSSLISRELFLNKKYEFRLNYQTSYSYFLTNNIKNISYINGLSLWPIDRSSDVGVNFST